MGALWRPRVLPYAEPGASAGGFERLLHEREGFEPETNGQLVCDKAFDGRGKNSILASAGRAVVEVRFAFSAHAASRIVRLTNRGLNHRLVEAPRRDSRMVGQLAVVDLRLTKACVHRAG